MTQLTLTDACTAESLKQQGQDAIAHTDTQFVTRLRQVAKEISLNAGFVSIDNLRIVADSLGWVPKHPNAWGSIFRGPQWKEIGRQKSALPSNHAREIRIWEWRP